MTIIELLTDYWKIIIGVAVGVVWGGNLAYRVWQVEKKICVDPSICEIQRTTCRAMFDSKLQYGEKEFDTIKKTMEKIELANERAEVLNEKRHSELITMIMSLQRQ